MTRILNAIAPETAALIRAQMSGRPTPPPIAKAPKRKRSQPVKCYVSQFHKFDPRKEAHTVQLPITFKTAEYNAGWTAPELRGAWVKEKRVMVWRALEAYFPNMRAGNVTFERVPDDELKYCEPSYVKFIPDDEAAVRAFCRRARGMRERARVRRIEFVRVGTRKLDDDNLVSAFKAIRDATCSFLRWGNEAPHHVSAIGTADDRLWKAGLRWTYRQQKCEANPRLYGIQIILHCAPRAEQP